MDPRLDRRRSHDTLEVDGQIEQVDEEGPAQEEAEYGPDEDGLVGENAPGNEGATPLPPLVHAEGDQQDDKADQAADDVRAAPRLLDAAPLHRQHEAHRAGAHEDRAHEVHLEDLLAEGSLDGRGGLGGSEEEDDRRGGDTAKGEVDVEAIVTTYQRFRCCCEEYCEALTYHQRQLTFWVNAPPMSGPTTEETAKVALKALVMAGRDFGRVEKARMMKLPANVPAHPAPVMARPAMNAGLLGAVAGGEASESPTIEDRLPPLFRAGGGGGKGSLTADQTPHLEDKNTQEEDNLDRKVLESLAPDRLGRGNGEEHGRAIPADVAQAVKVACDIGDRGRDDCLS